jgi:hypothetical protein
MSIDRRTFIGIGLAAVAAEAIPAFAAPPDPYDALVSGQYAGEIRIRLQGGGLYLGQDFKLSGTPATWRLRLGHYPGEYNGHGVDLHGYWIYKQNANQCWQAVNGGGGALQYWNADGKAKGSPEDYELFTFRQHDHNSRTIKIFNTSFDPRFTWNTGHVPEPEQERCYVGLTGDTFRCDRTLAQSEIFVIEFIP